MKHAIVFYVEKEDEIRAFVAELMNDPHARDPLEIARDIRERYPDSLDTTKQTGSGHAGKAQRRGSKIRR